jgi:hypothetical protein
LDRLPTAYAVGFLQWRADGASARRRLRVGEGYVGFRSLTEAKGDGGRKREGDGDAPDQMREDAEIALRASLTDVSQDDVEKQRRKAKRKRRVLGGVGGGFEGHAGGEAEEEDGDVVGLAGAACELAD